MKMLYKNFLMSEEFEGPHGHYTLEKGLLHVNYALKHFLVDTTWRCTWKLTLDKGLTIADIEEIVTNISPKPQSWRYISFSTAERSPKCNSTQEKIPSEQCVHTGKWKQHQDTLEKLFYCSTSVHHLESFQLKLEPQLHKLGPINGFFPWWWRYACAGLKLELIPFHIFHIWVGLGLRGKYLLSIICIFWMESYTKFQYTFPIPNLRPPNIQIFLHPFCQLHKKLLHQCFAMEQLCLLSKG